MGCGASVVDEALAKQKRQGDRAREPSKVPRGHSVKVKVESLKSLEDRRSPCTWPVHLRICSACLS